MGRVLALGGRTVMTGRAGSADVLMTEIGRLPGRGRMTVAAGIARGDVITRLARGDRAVVAGGATAPHRAVIHLDNGLPARRRMAALAGARRGDMARALALCGRAVVATGTPATDLAVVESATGRPAARVVAGGAIIVTGDVIGRFAPGLATVMAALAATLHLTMIDA